MKKLLTLLMLGILLANCADKKTEPEKVVETVESVVKNLGNTENGTLKIIDSYQEILLKQKGNKCGEWGGDTEEIRIYKSKRKGSVFVDYKKSIIDCKDPYSEKSKPKIIEKNEISLNQSELNLAQESITELIDYKLTNEQRISHSGIGNYVISRDSTLIIEDWPSFGWPKFRELVKRIENK
ncbi:MAG: hypothetical protein ABJP52_17050 [Flavobacteriaceae bacterium]